MARRGMTPEELETVRLKLQVQALSVMVEGLYTALANTDVISPQALRESFAKLRSAHSKVVLKNLDAATSDLVSSEYQEILDALLLRIEKKLKP